MRLLLVTAASLLALLTTMTFVVLAGAALPMWIMIGIYGRKAVQDTPAHGGTILLLTLPAALALSPFAFAAAYSALRGTFIKPSTQIG